MQVNFKCECEHDWLSLYVSAHEGIPTFRPMPSGIDSLKDEQDSEWMDGSVLRHATMI